MMSAIIVGMIGTYFLLDQGLVKLSIKPTILGGTITGGVLFGVGWACWATARYFHGRPW